MHTISEYAEKYRLRMKRDRCGDLIVPGKLGHLYEHGSGRFGMVLEASADSRRLDNVLRSRKRRALAGGFAIRQEGDSESIVLFDPAEQKQARLALRLVGAKSKRRASPAQLASFEKLLARRASLALGKAQQLGKAPEPSPVTSAISASDTEIR
jgi:hypothetical protein